jgi:hypothetical protein
LSAYAKHIIKNIKTRPNNTVKKKHTNMVNLAKKHCQTNRQTKWSEIVKKHGRASSKTCSKFVKNDVVETYKNGMIKNRQKRQPSKNIKHHQKH